MCLIIFAYKSHPKYDLILAANRDESYARPTKEAHWHGAKPKILSGIDHHAGGTWMGITKCGRFAALTNYRNPADTQPHRASRGKLVNDFLKGGLSAPVYSGILNETAGQYNGYNLIFGYMDNLNYYSNKTQETILLGSGLYGLSNHLLDTEWPKVIKGKSDMQSIISAPFEREDLFRMMTDDTLASDDNLPDTGLTMEEERTLSPMFIKSKYYGTRCSTVLTIDKNGAVAFIERTYGKAGISDAHFEFSI